MYVSNEVIDNWKIFRVSLTINNYHTMIFALICFDLVGFLAKPFAPQLIQLYPINVKYMK